jgi:hypothetical protein
MKALRPACVTGFVSLAVLGGAGANARAAVRGVHGVRSQNSLSFTVTSGVVAGHPLTFAVHYTAIEDGGSRASLFVESHPGGAACVDDPYTTNVSGGFLVQAEQVSSSGTRTVSTFAPPAGRYTLCAWLINPDDDSTLAAATSGLTLVAAPSEQSWIGHTSQHQKFGLGTYGETVIGINYPQTKLVCSGTTPTVDWVTVAGLPDQLSLKIDSHRAFGGSFRAGPVGNRVTVHGRLTGNSVVGTLTDTLHPVQATGMTTNTPPARRITGGVCRATIGFSAKHVGRS